MTRKNAHRKKRLYQMLATALCIAQAGTRRGKDGDAVPGADGSHSGGGVHSPPLHVLPHLLRRRPVPRLPARPRRLLHPLLRSARERRAEAGRLHCAPARPLPHGDSHRHPLLGGAYAGLHPVPLGEGQDVAETGASAASSTRKAPGWWPSSPASSISSVSSSSWFFEERKEKRSRRRCWFWRCVSASRRLACGS